MSGPFFKVSFPLNVEIFFGGEENFVFGPLDHVWSWSSPKVCAHPWKSPILKRTHPETFFRAFAGTEMAQNYFLYKIKKLYDEKHAGIRNLDNFDHKWDSLEIAIKRHLILMNIRTLAS